MRAEIKSLFSLNIDDLDRFVPANPLVFRVPIRLIAGPQGEEGEESFDFEVCSPDWLATEIAEGEVILLRHRVLMKSFNFEAVRNFVERFVHGCEGATWDDVASKLGRLGHWEFEDYRG